MKTFSTLAAAAAFMGFATVAAADGPAAGSQPYIPGSASMDRTHTYTHFAVSASTSFFEGDDPDFNTRLDLHGQYVSAEGIGGFVAIPLTLIFDSVDEAALGNLEVGGLFNVRAASVPVVLRAGILLPTAADDITGSFANFATSFGRFTDFVGIFPDTTWVRVSASPLYRHMNAFLRADAGIDIALDSPENIDADPVIRFNLAAGVLVGNAAISAEFVTLGTTGELADDEDRFFHTLTFNVRGKLDRGTELFGAFAVPVDFPGDFVEFVLMFGVQVPVDQI